jgi:hypothetical protein
MDRLALEPYVLFCASCVLVWCAKAQQPKNSKLTADTMDLTRGGTLSQLIGNTPLVKLEKLSMLTGCDIYAKVWRAVYASL